ncbi:MAG: alanine racemase, partial [Candidatus Binatia bacterium]
MVTLPEGRPTVCFVDLNALGWNFRQIRSKVGPQVKILSMVKANGYGHGATAIAKALAAEGSDAFGVATVEEGVELRQAGIGTPILVLAGAYPDQVDQFFDNSLTPVIHASASLEELDTIVHRRKKALNVHLKIDTGMGRIGLLAAEFDSWLQKIKTLKALKIEGVFSHFSHAESVEGNYTQEQLRLFQSVVERLRAEGIPPS